MAINRFIKELKRRNVYKVAITYAIIAWLIIQIASVVLPTINAPGWIMQTLLFFLLIGFPIALVLAWAFEMSPEGIIRTTSQASAENPFPNHRKKPLTHNLTLALLLVVVVAQFLYIQFSSKTDEPASTSIYEKSIAVLPFTNESSDQENQYFCNGIMEGILNHLTKIPDLAVISRSSVEQFRNDRPTAKEIADKLKVKYLVEGSVQKIDDQAVIYAQLIEAADDKHLWSNMYNRSVSDVLAIQAEITQIIASQLKTIIAPEIKESIESIPTENSEAYDFYLRGMYFYNDRFGGGEEYIEKAMGMFNKAVELDPDFAKAHLQLGYCHDYFYYTKIDGTKERADNATFHFEKALTLEPLDPQVLEGQGWYQYHIKGDYRKAKSIFTQVAIDNPQSATPLNALGVINGRLGQWREAEENFEASLSLDPYYITTYLNYVLNQSIQRKYSKAREMLTEILNISPKNIRAHEETCRIMILAEGDVDGAIAFFIESGLENPTHMRQMHTLSREFIEDDSMILPTLEEADTFDDLADISMILYNANRKDDMQEFAEKAITVGNEYLKRAPTDYTRMARMGLVYALLGQRDAALENIGTALEARSSARDALLGPELELVEAKILTVLGEIDESINKLRDLLSKPAYLTTSLLRVDPIWDSVRDNEEFQRLIEAD